MGGGIFTKAADVGTDLVGKIEAGIPEDDPRNPGVIADNVGDNVGDVAGMGADLFESYVSSIIAAIALAATAAAIGGSTLGWKADQAVLPLMLAGAGIVAAILGTFVVRSGETAEFGQLLWALRRGIFASAALLAVFALIVVLTLDMEIVWFWAVLVGLAAGLIIGLSTEYYTSYEYGPTKGVAETSQTGAATVMISGIATGMISTVIPVIAIGVTILIAFELADFYGVALAGVGLLSTLGITLATDAYGPVADRRRRHRRAGAAGPRGAGAHRCPGRLGKHHRGHGKGVCHRLGGPHFPGPAGGICRSLRPAGGGCVPRDKPAQPHHPGGAVVRRYAAFPVFGIYYESGGSGSLLHRQRGTPPVPGDPRNHGRHRPAGLRQVRCHQHQRSPEGNDGAGADGRTSSHRHWVRPGH